MGGKKREGAFRGGGAFQARLRKRGESGKKGAGAALPGRPGPPPPGGGFCFCFFLKKKNKKKQKKKKKHKTTKSKKKKISVGVGGVKTGGTIQTRGGDWEGLIPNHGFGFVFGWGGLYFFTAFKIGAKPWTGAPHVSG